MGSCASLPDPGPSFPIHHLAINQPNRRIISFPPYDARLEAAWGKLGLDGKMIVMPDTSTFSDKRSPETNSVPDQKGTEVHLTFVVLSIPSQLIGVTFLNLDQSVR